MTSTPAAPHLQQAPLIGLLAGLNPQASLVERHLWLVRLFGWIRGDPDSPALAAIRVTQLVDVLQADPALALRARQMWQTLLATVDTTTLLADHGFASGSAFIGELAERVRLKVLPGTPETTDAGELFSLMLPQASDALWLAALDEPTVEALASLLSPADVGGLSVWQQAILDALTFCTSQIRASGFAPEMRLRMTAQVRETEPFHALAADFDALRVAFMAGLKASPNDAANSPAEGDSLQAALAQFRTRLDLCRQAANTVYTHLDEHGISVDLVFRLRQLRERVLRIRALLDCLMGTKPVQSTVRLLGHLAVVGQERRSLRALVGSNMSLLAAKVTERSSETGEHYITRTPEAYREMLRKAAGGGALTAITTALKFSLAGVGLSLFWNGFWAGVLYAASFVVIQLLHWTLATKQPAMTAPAMAAKLKDLSEQAAVEGFVDEVTHLVRSQVAAVIGNVGVVVPVVLALSLGMRWATHGPLIDADKALHVLESLTLLGPTLLFAALTGVLLFASSIIAGWTENWFVMHRLQSALRYNPRITRLLGAQRAAWWSQQLRDKISGIAANVSLGFMLGLVPAFAAFFGLGLDVRHVTLSAGQLAAAVATLGWPVLQNASFWWCVAALPLIGLANLLVSFYLAFRLAAQAGDLARVDQSRVSSAVRARLRSQPMSFLWPPMADNPPDTDNRHG